MGQCYSVRLRAKFKDEGEFVRRSADYLSGFNYGQAATPMDFVKFVMAGKEGLFSVEPLSGGFVEFKGDFDAPYMWEIVLDEWFHAVAPALEDESEIEVYPDRGRWCYRVKGGAAI